MGCRRQRYCLQLVILNKHGVEPSSQKSDQVPEGYCVSNTERGARCVCAALLTTRGDQTLDAVSFAKYERYCYLGHPINHRVFRWAWQRKGGDFATGTILLKRSLGR